MKSASRRRRSRGFSVTELILATAIMSIMMVVLGEALLQAQGSFRNVSGASDSSDTLRKVTLMMRRELLQTSAAQIGSGFSCNSLGSPDGYALWFLSNVGSDGQPHFMVDGSPFWQRNVLYYLVVPNDHNGLFGQNCVGGAGPSLTDDRCPHKVLIRKVIDFGAATDFTNEANIEPLMTGPQVAAYLTRPNGYKTQGMMAEAGIKTAQVVGRNLLTFVVTVPGPGSVTLDTRATSIARARNKVALGNVSLFNSPFTFHFSLTVSPSIP